MARIIKRAPSPSKSIESAAAVKRAVLDRGGPRYGRPAHRFGPPTALFSKPLALLKYSLEHLESFTPDSMTLNRAFSLIAGATGFFVDESKREASLKPVLQELLMGQNEWQEQTTDRTAESCGVWLEDHFGYLIITLKNEPGLGGDPFLQGLFVYSKITTQEEVRYFPFFNNLPCTESHYKVRPIPQAIQHACHSVGYGGEPSCHIDCYFHQRYIRGRVALY